MSVIVKEPVITDDVLKKKEINTIIDTLDPVITVALIEEEVHEEAVIKNL